VKLVSSVPLAPNRYGRSCVRGARVVPFRADENAVGAYRSHRSAELVASGWVGWAIRIANQLETWRSSRGHRAVARAAVVTALATS